MFLIISININHLFAHSEVVTKIANQHKWFYSTLIIRLLTVTWFQVLTCNTNNSNKHQSLIYTQLNDKTVLFISIQFGISHLFAHSLNVEQFYPTHK